VIAARPAAGGGQFIELSPTRVRGWFVRFGERHGGVRHTDLTDSSVGVEAADGAHAVLDVPFAPLVPADGTPLYRQPGRPPLRRQGLDVDDLVTHLLMPRRIGIVLVRLGAHSTGVAESGRVIASTTDRAQVHGRNKAGGWSQQRYARRRQGQVRESLRAAADDVVRVLVPRLPELVAVVLGGDRRALDVLREDPRLAAVFAIAQLRVFDVPEPRRAVLDDVAERARSVEILVTEP
jgi:hypothetical protein